MSYTLDIPLPMPAEGMRTLTHSEIAQRIRGKALLASPLQCQGQVYVSLFFDGTGNNKNWTEPGLPGTQQALDKHSNVARLYNASIDQPSEGLFRNYIPGIGTPFAEIGDHGGMLGDGFGYMGANRINWGISRVLNAANAYLTRDPLFDERWIKTYIQNLSYDPLGPAGRGGFERELAKLAAVVAQSQRLLTRINVAVFGFSRGAAQARVFAHWLFGLAQREGGTYTLAGVPLRLYFMGLFDTVASVGIPDAVPGFHGHMAWAGEQLGIHPAVEQCIHFVALHEQRASFPLEMAANVKQVGYPGMHSDVGGGYLPHQQGKLGHLSQIPLIDMYHEANKAGVPLLSAKEMQQRAAVTNDFTCPPELIEASNAFWRECGIAAASGEEAVTSTIHQHVRQYLQWRATLFFPGQKLAYRRFFQQATYKDKDDMTEAQTDFYEQMGVMPERRAITKKLDGLDVVEDLTPIPPIYRWLTEDPIEPLDADALELLDAMDKYAELPEAVHRLMDEYVHDSRAGFRPANKLEPHSLTGGYLRYRRLFENQRDVELSQTEIPLPSQAPAIPPLLDHDPQIYS